MCSETSFIRSSPLLLGQASRILEGGKGILPATWHLGARPSVPHHSVPVDRREVHSDGKCNPGLHTSNNPTPPTSPTQTAPPNGSAVG